MKGLRASVNRPVAITISIMALVLALGSGAYASAGPRPASPAALPQHSLQLIHGWQSADPGNGTGSPRYVVNTGIVYLSGSLTLPSGSNDQFAVLPSGARPGHVLYIPIYASQGAAGTVQVLPTGAIAVFSNTPGAAQAFSSLAGVSYPAGA
jgi:hypothetical protein